MGQEQASQAQGIGQAQGVGQAQSVNRAQGTGAKQGGVNGLKVACAVLAFCLAGLGGYVAYDKLVAKDVKTSSTGTTSVEAEEEVNEVDGGETAKVASGTRNGFAKDTDLGEFYVTKDGEVYFKAVEGSFSAGEHIKNLNMNFGATELIGEKGKYEIRVENIGDYFAWDAKTVEADYKLDVEDIVAIYDAGYGQNRVYWNYQLVDSQGRVHWLIVAPGNYGSANVARAKLFKNFGDYTDVKAVIETNGGDGFDAMLVFGDGTNKALSSDELEKLKVDSEY
ncbi:hypothetical protein IKF15_03020 [Candidatus Saccharibacteria bacterium]|nr:hypothetical protein [Candidatus Saccharibacteria bacterium]